MKKTAFILFGLMTANVQAQEIEIPITESFNEIKVYNKIEARLIPSTENKIIAKGVDKEEIEAKVRDKTLKIKSSLDNIWSEDDTMVEIYYTSAKIIDANEGSNVISHKKISQENLTLSAQEGSRIALELEVENLESKIYTGGTIKVWGNASTQEAVIKAGGEYNAEELRTEDTDVKISAGGIATIYASNSCKAKVSAGGTITIHGNPSTIEKKTTLGGNIIEKKE